MTSPARTVAVYGAGIAGLTAAHEFSRRGWTVTVYEAKTEAGGFFRSARGTGDHAMPSEYSWHGMGPWYHNVFDLMRQIPFDEQGSVYDRALSRPIDFGVAPDVGTAEFDDPADRVIDVRRMFRMTRVDRVWWMRLMVKEWTANRRSSERYATRNAAAEWGKRLSAEASSTWSACFGPWIGSDWTRVSLHQAGQFFLKQLTSKPSHQHAADSEGPAWTHGARSGWLLLRGPSSEFWFDRWIQHLTTAGVSFHWEQALHHFDYDGTTITAAHLESGERVEADVHVFATNPFAAVEILDRTPALARLDQLCLFKPLTADGPHVQVSFRIAFGEPIAWPRARCAVVVSDSEFDLTIFAEEQAWSAGVDLGDGVASLWTGTSCVSSVPGRVHGLPVAHCTKQQFIDEVHAQLLRCGSLDALIREANHGRSLASFPIVRIEVWHEWTFSHDGITGSDPKWVNSTHTQPFQPTQATPVPNLVLAGAHTRTAADVWSIEGAVESGRRAAQLIEPDVTVIAQHKPAALRRLGRIDDRLYRHGLPHLLDVLTAAVSVGLLAAIARRCTRRRR
ncbi:MAG: FAD-dependent oxidoreductase [Actinomycetota bacterium]|nr:FAD-dependent oxidoreductase [Actinomycetota bacterium]